MHIPFIYEVHEVCLIYIICNKKSHSWIKPFVVGQLQFITN